MSEYNKKNLFELYRFELLKNSKLKIVQREAFVIREIKTSSEMTSPVKKRNETESEKLEFSHGKSGSFFARL